MKGSKQIVNKSRKHELTIHKQALQMTYKQEKQMSNQKNANEKLRLDHFSSKLASHFFVEGIN